MRSLRLLLALLASAVALEAQAWPARAECIAPAKAGGGFDLTCQLLRKVVRLGPNPPPELVVRYMPGGIGAVAFDRAVTQNWSDPGVLVAFSTGSLMNLVQGRFGPHAQSNVQWLATLGTEYGVVAVRKGSRFQDLQSLMEQLRKNAGGAVFGAGGALGSQDWVKAALLVRAAGRDHRSMRFVSFEGGGQAIVALKAGHVEVFCGDAGEALPDIASGELRLLAVLAPKRQRGALAQVPTALEQGVDVVWSTVRGVYMGPGVPARDREDWVRHLRRVMATNEFANEARAVGLEPFPLVGAEAQAWVDREVVRMRELARELRLPVR